MIKIIPLKKMTPASIFIFVKKKVKFFYLPLFL